MCSDEELLLGADMELEKMMYIVCVSAWSSLTVTREEGAVRHFRKSVKLDSRVKLELYTVWCTGNDAHVQSHAILGLKIDLIMLREEGTHHVSVQEMVYSILRKNP